MRIFTLALVLGLTSCPDKVERLTSAVVKVENVGGRCAGVSISPTEVATAAHCADDEAPPPTVHTYDEQECEVEEVRKDTETDAALLIVSGCELDPVRVGEREPRVGDTVIVVGHPLSEPWTFSEGIVSKIGDRLVVDAAFNPGVSGGGVFDRRGRLIGIASAIRTPSPFGTWSGIGYAVPISKVLDLRD